MLSALELDSALSSVSSALNSDMPTPYLAVLKALYDYDTPQSDDEVAVKEDQLLFLLEKTDEDWWKVKIKSNSPDDTGPSGLVPSAYVEEASHTSVVRALYDYEANASGELTVKEDEVLYSYDTDDDWMLVKSQLSGAVGYVPGNYVQNHEQPTSEPTSPKASSAILNSSSVFISPSQSVSEPEIYQDPASRSAAVADRSKADDIQTWSLSELDAKGKKKKKGTLGVGNGALFFASTDKTPVQKWQMSEVQSAKTEKGKHVIIEITGAVTLRYHAGSKDAAEAVIKKINSSIEKPAVNDDTTAVERSANPSELHSSASPPRLSPIQTQFTEDPKKSTVHFTTSPPSVIPRSDDDEQHNIISSEAIEGVALYDFTAGGEDELSISEGDRLWIVDSTNEDWWTCRHANGSEGVVPASYIEANGSGNAEKHATATMPQEDDDKPESLEDPEEQLVEEDDHEEEARQAQLRETQERAKQALEAQRLRKQKEEDRRAAQAREQDKQAREQDKQREIQEAAQIAKEEEESRRQSKVAAAKREQRKKEAETAVAPERKKSRGPLPKQTRTWHDKTGQFQVDAEFLGLKDGKVRLHKSNGVVIEVPTVKMSPEDLDYIRRFMKKKAVASSPLGSKSPQSPDDDDVPLGSLTGTTAKQTSPTKVGTSKSQPLRKAPTIDWFEFFLSAGCDVDECTRYGAAFERDKIDESILPEIKESTMRSLGLREGDIIRVMKAIEQRTGSSSRAGGDDKDNQITGDEELARQLQAQEDSGKASDLPRRQNSASPGAPNLFAGPGGILKNNTRRGRPSNSKSGPPINVDLDSLNSAATKVSSPISNESVLPPKRSSSIAVPNGFEDEAWTNRGTSTKASSRSPERAISSSSTSKSEQPITQPLLTPTPSVDTQQTKPKPGDALSSANFDILAKISQMRPPSAPIVQTAAATTPSPAPSSFQTGLGMGSSPVSLGVHLQNQQTGFQSSLPLSNARGPLAPVPSNQPLLNPLIPTTTGFNSFVPTRPHSAVPSVPSFYPANSGNFQNPAFAVPQFQPVNMLPLQVQPTGYSPFNQLPPSIPSFASQNLQSPSYPNTYDTSLSSRFSNPNPPNTHSPANIFAQMKSGTFGQDDAAQAGDKYDPFRNQPVTSPMLPQPTGYPFQPGYTQNGYTGFGR